MTVKIIDTALPADLAVAVSDWLEAEPFIYGWKARANANGKFWHRNYVLPGTHDHHYDDGVWNPAMSYDSFIQSGNPLAAAAQIVCERYFGGTPLTRVWVNKQSYGDESALHRDFPEQFAGKSKTMVWYPVPEWDIDWGGDLVVVGDDGEIESAVAVKPNRAVVFDGTKRHVARPTSRYCNALRVAVAFGCEVVENA